MENNVVEFYRMDSQYMNDSIDRIVVEIHTKKNLHNKKVILLSGCGSTTGVTSISINLAIALSIAGWKTLLIDCDLRKSNAYKRLATKTTVGLSEYLSRQASKDEIIHQTNYEYLDYISSGNPETSAVRLLCSAEMNDIMQSVQAEYDYIIIDTPSINIVSDSSILFPVVDGIVLVAALNITTKRQLNDARRVISHYKDKYYGLIINQVDMKQYKMYMKDYDYFRKKNMDKKHEYNMKKVIEKKGREKKVVVSEEEKL